MRAITDYRGDTDGQYRVMQDAGAYRVASGEDSRAIWCAAIDILSHQADRTAREVNSVPPKGHKRAGGLCDLLEIAYAPSARLGYSQHVHALCAFRAILPLDGTRLSPDRCGYLCRLQQQKQC